MVIGRLIGVVHVLGLGHQLRQPKIQYFCLSAFRDEDVGGLDVAMYHSGRMCGDQRARDLNRQIEQNVGLEGLSGDITLERQACQKFHDNVGLAFVIAHVMDGANVGVVERRRGDRFAPKTLQDLTVFRYFFWEELEGHLTAKDCVFSLVDHSHAAAAELAQYAIARHSFPDHFPVSCRILASAPEGEQAVSEAKQALSGRPLCPTATLQDSPVRSILTHRERRF